MAVGVVRFSSKTRDLPQSFIFTDLVNEAAISATGVRILHGSTWTANKSDDDQSRELFIHIDDAQGSLVDFKNRLEIILNRTGVFKSSSQGPSSFSVRVYLQV